MQRPITNYKGILIHARDGKNGGKIADIFTDAIGRIRVYVSKNVMSRCGVGGMIPFTLLQFSVSVSDEGFVMAQYEGSNLLDMMKFSYDEMRCWYYVIEIIEEFFPYEQKNQSSYMLIGRALESAGNKNRTVAAMILAVQLLAEAGFSPEYRDGNTGIRISENARQLLTEFLQYDWMGSFEGRIKVSAFRELARYIDSFIKDYCDVQLKTAGIFLQ